MGQFAALASLAGGGMGGGYSASSGANVSNANSSINSLGGGAFNLNEYLANAGGARSNGGWTSAVQPPGFAGGLTIGGGSSTLLLLGGVALLGMFLLLRR